MNFFLAWPRFLRGAMFCLILTALPSLATAQTPDTFPRLEQEYRATIRPILAKYCLDCHSTEAKEGELDLQRFSALAEIRRDPKPWPSVVEMVATQEMPPEKSKQPTAAEREQLLAWSRDFVAAEARARSGDPGPVVLRRLNNSEYKYTIQDLTGVALDPAKEFPADGAAGEGFTNAGNALAMSPALVQKYLDAGHAVAAHAVLLPDGVRFSPHTTRRDWADDLVTQIRLIYARHTSGQSATSILDRWNADPLKSFENDGRVDLAKYFAALIKHRQQLTDDPKSAAEIANSEMLNAKYLAILHFTLQGKEPPKSTLLARLRQRLAAAKENDAASLAAEVRAWQEKLWKFNTVGHLGLVRPWQEGVNPLTDAALLKLSLPAGDADPTIYLSVGAAGDGDQDDAIVWTRPRIEFKDRPAIMLRDVRGLTQRLEHTRTVELARTTDYLQAILEARASDKTVEQLASDRQLDPSLLAAWVSYTSLANANRPQLTGHFARKVLKIGGYEGVNGWATGDLPLILSNRSNEPATITTLTVPPRAVTVHPNPTQASVVAWKAPRGGSFQIAAKFADADDKCGNGAAWQIERWSGARPEVLQQGTIDNGKSATAEVKGNIDLQAGEFLLLVVSARDRDHTCDTTHIEFTISETAGDKQHWDLAEDIVDNILESNPHADSHGNRDVWHFCLREEDKTKAAAIGEAIPATSALANWRQAVIAEQPAEVISKLAAVVEDVATDADEAQLSAADRALRKQLTDWNGPLNWLAAKSSRQAEAPDKSTAADNPFGLDPQRFGVHPQGKELDAASLFSSAEQVLEIRLPQALVAGGEFVVDAQLDPSGGQETSVQPLLTTAPPTDLPALLPGYQVLSRGGSPARARLTQAYEEFRQVFPLAMCHARIVPVDEVVTLLLYHREDEPLKRLMLSPEETARLNELWRELLYVSQAAIRTEVSLEQILEFATQDADPKVFNPVRKPIADNAAALRAELLATEPAHWQALLDFASRAWRRPLRGGEAEKLKRLYDTLREEGLSHEEAWRTMFARVIASPAFLYRLEKTGPGKTAVAVSDWELSSRLSYFLWSSLPDTELRDQASAGTLSKPENIVGQTRRMLDDDRTRRLAIEFACQWLHIRDFDQLDEKSERHFPQFKELRGAMYEESILYFADLFRRDGSILEILDSDHTFLNEPLAKLYGIEGVQGTAWRRVDGVKKHSRGGILAQATTLASQSGASRTSPILRGNWVSETLLGERLPRPPKNVPQLPTDEADLAGLTVRQIVEKHTSDQACNKCHRRIDPYGFALEEFDAIGRRRDKDLGGLPIETATVVMDGTKIDGLDGLRNYLVNTRRETFVRQFCRKLLGYALGRGVQLSDEPLLTEMAKNLSAQDYKFSAAVETIVLSPQFRMIRGNLVEE